MSKLKEELSKILIKHHIIDRYSRSPLDRGGAENFLRGCGWSHDVKSDDLLEDLSSYIMNDVPWRCMPDTSGPHDMVYKGKRYKLVPTMKEKK